MNPFKKDKMKQMKHRYMWRDKMGEFHFPEDMPTRHLFFTLRMIWNHTAPPDGRIEPYKRYKFDNFYTTEYMSQSVKVLMTELIKRKDLAPYWKQCLDHMIRYSNLQKIKEVPQWKEKVE